MSTFTTFYSIFLFFNNMQICSLRVKWIVVANCVSSLNKWNDETKKEFYLRHGIGNSIQDFSI